MDWANVQPTPLEEEAVVASFQATWAKAELGLDPTEGTGFTGVHFHELPFRGQFLQPFAQQAVMRDVAQRDIRGKTLFGIVLMRDAQVHQFGGIEPMSPAKPCHS